MGPVGATFAAIDALIGELTSPPLELGGQPVRVYSQPVDNPGAPAIVCEWPVVPLTLTGACVDVTEARLDVLCIASRLDARSAKAWLASMADHVLERFVGAELDEVDGVEAVELAELGPLLVAGVDHLAARLTFVIDPALT